MCGISPCGATIWWELRGVGEPQCVGRNKRAALRPSCLAEFAGRVWCACPVWGKYSRHNVAVERRERPIAHASDKAVLHGIDVAILHVTAIIVFVPDQVFPKPALPHASFTASTTNFAQPLRHRYRFRELDLDQAPPRRKVGIAGGQGPNRVDMIGQYDECVDSKWMALARASCCLAQRRDLLG